MRFFGNYKDNKIIVFFSRSGKRCDGKKDNVLGK